MDRSYSTYSILLIKATYTLILLLLTTRLFANADSTATEKRFSKKELTQDLSYMIRSIERVHPNMYHSLSKSDYRRLSDSVGKALKEGMTGREAWPILARMVGAIGEGHSVFNYPDSVVARLKQGGKVLFPVMVQEYNGRNFVVRGDVSEEAALQPGDEITAINNIPTSELVDLLSGYAGGLKVYRSVDVCRNLITYLYLYNIQAPYTIDYIRKGQTGRAILNAINWDELRKNAKTRGKSFLPNPAGEPFSFNYPDARTAYLGINSLTGELPAFKKILDSCFNNLKLNHREKLIIDLRKNGGGNSQLGELLLSYITDKSFRMSGGVKWKVSEEYKSQLDKNQSGKGAENMPYYFNAVNGTILSDTDIKEKAPGPNPLRYQGKVFVLIGPRTFSSANMLANAIQDYKLATLVGQSSGEPANDYGELVFLTLPHTGFSFSTSTKQFIRANGDAKDGSPVLPQLEVADNPLTPVDEVLEFLKNR
ncbi:S41 family peptidase [Pedobacter frigidisoli]|uniref:S41 family peptidase n=1 Tax=Pedobacter frigidisoli TaxID=2530455 RepID=UPI002930FF56|nr:S41 family peptidase [Pedobacter frigidisoli]